MSALLRFELDWTGVKDGQGGAANVYSTEHPAQSVVLTHETTLSKITGDRFGFVINLGAIARGSTHVPHVVKTPIPGVVSVAWNEEQEEFKNKKDLLTKDDPKSLVLAIYQENDYTVEGAVYTKRYMKKMGSLENAPHEIMTFLHLDTVIMPWKQLIDAAVVLARGNASRLNFAFPITDVRLATQTTIEGKRGTLKATVTLVSSTLEWLENQIEPAERLSELFQSRQDPDKLIEWKNAYVNEYCKPFPQPFDKFMRVGGMMRLDELPRSGSFKFSPSDRGFWIARAQNLVNIHMPTFDIYASANKSNAIALPIFYYHAHRAQHVGELHETFMLSLLDASLFARGLSRTLFNTWIADLQSTQVDNGLCAAISEVLVGMLTAYAHCSKYRADYRDSSRGKHVDIESVDIDLLQDADCDDLSNKTDHMIDLLLNGRLDRPLTMETAPVLFKSSRIWSEILMPMLNGRGNREDAATRSGTSAFIQPRECGTWDNPLLSTLQWILGHYMPCSVLGSVLAAFPGATKQLQQLPLVEPSQIPRHKELLEKLGFGTSSDQACVVGAHQYSVLLPFTTWALGMKTALTEIEASATLLGGRDGLARQRVLELCKTILKIKDDLWPTSKLGGLLLESTARTSPFLVAPKTENANDQALEFARNMAFALRKASIAKGGTIQVLDNHAMRLLPNEPLNRRASGFYRDVMHLHCIRLFDLIPEARDMCSLCPVSADRWGIPLEHVLQGAVLQNWGLLPILHRVPSQIRDRGHTQSVWVQRTQLPPFPPFAPKSYTCKALAVTDEVVWKNIFSRSTPEIDSWLSKKWIPRCKPIMGDTPASKNAWAHLNGIVIMSIPLLGATWEDDWKRVADFMEQRNLLVSSATETRLIPVFGMTTIVLCLYKGP